MAESRFQTFITRLRPHKVAVLINIADPDWQKTCLRVIEWLTQTWGGANSIIVPTNGKTIDPPFWELLSSFDPDTIAIYRKTHADTKLNDPGEFEKLVQQHIANAKLEGFYDQHTEQRAREYLPTWRVDNFDLTDDLKKQLVLRLSPFHFENQPHLYWISAGDTPPYPFTNVIHLLDVVEHPDRITEIEDLSAVAADLPPLWLLAQRGIASAQFQADLSKSNIITTFKSLSVESESNLIALGVRPELHQVHTPYALSRLSLNPVRSTLARPFLLPSIIVVGGNLTDFCLYFALSRLQMRAIWMPPWFLPKDNKFPSRMVAAVRILEDIARQEHSQLIALMSSSVPVSDLQDLVQNHIRKHISTISCVVEDANNVAFIRRQVEHPVKWYIKGGAERITTHQLIDGKLEGPFESPVPSSFTRISPVNHRYLVEITFSQHETPRHPALGRVMVYGPNMGYARSTMDGVAYMCPGAMVMSDDIELQILRPSITVPKAEEIFRIAFDNCGYEMTVSDKGAYETQTIEKFGGIGEIGGALRHNRLSTLLRKFLDKSSPGDDVYDEGVFLNYDKRRYLNFACINKILADTPFARDTIDKYISKEILYRGFALKCKRCANLAWFSVAEVTHTFTCKRCGTNQQYVQASWNHPDEPSWFYKLDEIVYQMLTHNGDATLLALDSLQYSKSTKSFMHTPELRIRPNENEKWTMEIDICCVINGMMFIGEAKSVDTLKTNKTSALQSANEYREIADKLGASGVLFSTTAPQWDEATEQAIVKAFAAHPHLRVMKFTSANL